MEHLDIIRMYVVTIRNMSMEKVDIPVAVMVAVTTAINLCKWMDGENDGY